MRPRISNLINADNQFTLRESTKEKCPENVLSPNTSTSQIDMDAHYTIGLDTDLECASESPLPKNKKFSSNVST
jgi:hypothetical protein